MARYTIIDNQEQPADENSNANAENFAAETATKRRKIRIVFDDYLPKFKALAKEGKSQGEICRELGIDTNQFFRLYFLLNQKDDGKYTIDAKAGMRKCKVKENGFIVSRARLASLGLDKIFSEGKELKFKRNGSSLVIDVVE